MTELAPVDLQDTLNLDLGDLNHPAISRALDQSGLFTAEQILTSAGPCPPPGPLYTPKEVVDLALKVSDSGSPNWQGLKIPVKSHLNLQALNFILEKFPDPWVLRGSTYG